jgi:hypothetical protein
MDVGNAPPRNVLENPRFSSLPNCPMFSLMVEVNPLKPRLRYPERKRKKGANYAAGRQARQAGG